MEKLLRHCKAKWQLQNIAISLLLVLVVLVILIVSITRITFFLPL